MAKSLGFAYFVPIELANFFSNFINSFLRIKSPVSINFFNWSHKSGAFVNYCFKIGLSCIH